MTFDACPTCPLATVARDCSVFAHAAAMVREFRYGLRDLKGLENKDFAQMLEVDGISATVAASAICALCEDGPESATHHLPDGSTEVIPLRMTAC